MSEQSAAMAAVLAYRDAKVQYATAYGRDLQDDLDLLDSLESMQREAELSCTAEAAFNMFVNAGKRVSMLGQDENLLQACWDSVAEEVQNIAQDFGLYTNPFGAQEWL